jgi:N-acetylmuramoyl-L-alanine amidase
MAAVRRLLVSAVAVALLLAGCGGVEKSPPGGSDSSTSDRGAGGSAEVGAAIAGKPLAGKVVVLDPGHQLGNRRFGSRINRPVDAGGFRKACNTTGTSTNGGYPEATFAWKVALKARRMLERLGAEVVLTRSSNSMRRWGPCIDVRGRAGNPGRPGPTADAKVSIHGDGCHAAGAHGFHVIRPGVRRGWTDDIARPSRRLAGAVRDALVESGFARSTYRGRNGVDVRRDLGTLNHSDVPVVMAELGNMRSARDARVMVSAKGQKRYARALVRGLRGYLE